MNATLGATRFMGASVRRREDLRLLTGRGTYVDDMKLPGMLHAAFLRSPYAHAVVRSVDTAEAAGSPGVAATVTGQEVARSAKPLPIMLQFPGCKSPTYHCLALRKVRFVGQPVAAVAAADPYAAKDAAEMVKVEYEPLPVVVDAEKAMRADAPVLHEDLGDNIVHHVRLEAGDVEKAFEHAHLVLKERFCIQRCAGTPLEPHAVLAHFEPERGTLTVRSAAQMPFNLRTALADVFNLPEERVRVIVEDTGGSFGNYKYYPEDIVTCLLSIMTGRPVKWVAERSEILLAAGHAREQVHDVEVAAGKDGAILGFRDRLVADMGAYLMREATGPPNATVEALPGPYRLPNVLVELFCVLTNKTPLVAYRGYGQPQACVVMERVMDIVARELGMDPSAVRLKNFIGRDEFPYKTSTGVVYDSGDYPACLERGLIRIGYNTLRQEQREQRRNGRYVGVGVAFYVEPTGGVSSVPADLRLGRRDGATVRIDREGKPTLLTGLSPHGQGSETMLAQLTADTLGVNMEDVEVIRGDTEVCPFGQGTFGSRNAVVAANTVVSAAAQVREKMLRVAGHLLGVKIEDLEMGEGRIYIRSSPERGLSVKEIARAAYDARGLPGDVKPGLEATGRYEPSGLPCSYGVHIPVVEVEPETGSVNILRYFVVYDCGRVINPMVVEGQVHGGVVQGLGGALCEQLVYDAAGQLMTSTLMDYLIPRAIDAPNIEVDRIETLTPLNPLGVKGVGQGGAIASAAAMANAVEDALTPFSIRVRELPLTEERLWRLIRKARGRRSGRPHALHRA